jgi:hypothetical protein
VRGQSPRRSMLSLPEITTGRPFSFATTTAYTPPVWPLNGPDRLSGGQVPHAHCRIALVQQFSRLAASTGTLSCCPTPDTRACSRSGRTATTSS